MKLEDIRKMAEKYSVLDYTELDIESLKLPQLHNKYINIYHDEKLLLSKFTSDLKKGIRIKWEYYTGKLDEDTLKELGLEPFSLKILKTDIDKYLESDDEIITLSHRVDYQKEKIDYLESTIKELNTRHWKIRNAIEWKKFVNGV